MAAGAASRGAPADIDALARRGMIDLLKLGTYTNYLVRKVWLEGSEPGYGD